MARGGVYSAETLIGKSFVANNFEDHNNHFTFLFKQEYWRTKCLPRVSICRNPGQGIWFVLAIFFVNVYQVITKLEESI